MESLERNHTERNAETGCANRWSSYTTGLIIMAVGVIFLLRNFGVDFRFFELDNWWAFFIFIGAVHPLQRAIAAYRRSGQFSAEVLHSTATVIAICTVALMFILELDWGKWWPLFMIIGGLYTIAGRRERERS